MLKKRLLIIALITLAVGVFIGFDLGQYIDFDLLSEWVKEEPLKAGVVFALIYVLVASLSLPGAGPLSLVAGAVFGLWFGVLIVSFASTIGATIAMLISRTLLQEWVQKRFGSFIEKVNKGVDENGGQYLFSLRLIPVIPFFIVNVVFGLTKLPARTFYFVSQAGMLPATLLYVNAGASLGRVEKLSLADVFTPQVILSFAALIAFPFVLKYLMKNTKLFKQSTDV